MADGPDRVVVSRTPRPDDDGFAPIGDHAVLGDGRSVALLTPDGRVDWWAVPRLDSPPAFAALLDPARGGALTLHPVEPVTAVERRYLPGTNVLETVLTTAGGRVRLTEALDVGASGELPWSELARRVEGVDGTVELAFTIAPGTGLGSWEPWVEPTDRGPVLHAGEVTIGLSTTPGVRVEAGPAQVTGKVLVREGERHVVGFVATGGEPLFLPDAASVDHRLDLTVERGRRWSDQIRWDGDRRDRVVRSALALKLLVMTGTGAIAAAATTSLPERVGGPKNWDYRYAWVRDAALTVDALSLCGLQEEVHAAVTWLLRTIRAHGPDLHVMYGLGGEIPTSSTTADVPGYRGSRPVRLGNDAAGQLQLGIYGDLFGTVATWIDQGHVLDVRTARELADLADRCADVWHHDDAGIWELHTNRPYTSSKMNCWRALDTAARLADAGHINGPDRRWRHAADRIRAWIEEHCWSDRVGAYTFYAGTDELDASVLLGATFGYDRGPRMRSTIAALERELGAGPLLYRYSGVEREEATFLACAFWAVQAKALTGDVAGAEQRLRELDAVASPLGLLSEMAEAHTYELIGNIPQALSHLAFIQAASSLHRAPHHEG